MTLSDWIKRRRGGVDDAVAFDTALFSLTTQVPRPTERRADPRALPFLPVAKLVRASGDSLCRIRNISAGGLMAEVTEALDAEEAVTIEIHSGRRIPANVAWIRDANAGFRFAAEVDIRTVFSGERPRIGYRPRPPRLDLGCKATVRIGRVFHEVAVQDISAGGMKVALAASGIAGKKVVVTIEHLPPVKGSVRWWKDGMAGIAFDRMLPFEELTGWLGKRIDVASVRGAVEGKR
jgi:hypothetical protein